MSTYNLSEQMDDEVWKSVEGWEDYEVSNKGRVRSRKSRWASGVRYLACSKNVYGYPRVGLFKDGITTGVAVHRLVAMLFIPNPDNLPQVNHIDGNKTNNNVNNLEWVTCQENIQHAVRTGLKPPSGKPFVKVRVVETGEIFNNLSDCARAINSTPGNVSACVCGRQHSTRGYHFERI